MESIYANGSRNHHRFTLTVTETYVSGGAENYSDVSFDFVLSSLGGNYDWYYSGGNPVTYTFTINGVNYAGTILTYDGRSTVTVRSGTQRIVHDGDGAKTIDFSFSVNSLDIYYLPGSASASGTMQLTTIPRYAAVTQTVSSKTETAIAMNWSSDAVVDKVYYSLDNGTSWTEITIQEGTSGGYTISALAAGTSYQIITRVRRKDSQLISESAALTVSTYSYPYANTMPNFTIGDQLTIGLYNPLGRSVYVALIGADDGQIAELTTSGASVSGFNDSESVDLLYLSIPNAASGTYSVSVNYAGSHVTVRSGGTYSVKVSECLPSISLVNAWDTNSATTTVTGDNKKIVQNQSQVTLFANRLQAEKYASIVSCSCVVNGVTHALTLYQQSGDLNASASGVTIDSGTDVTAVFTATDSRGLQTTKQMTITMLPWSIPSAIITLNRRSNFYSESDLLVDADYSSLNNGNSVTITYRYKKTSESYIENWSTAQDGVTATFTADNTFAWDVQVKIVDRLGGTVVYNLFLPVGMPIVFFDRLLLSTGFNCFPRFEKSVEINGSVAERNAMTRGISASVTNLTEGSFAAITLNTSTAAGSRLTASNGGIEIGAGITKVMISGSMEIQAATASGVRKVVIVKNSYASGNIIASNWSSMSAGDSAVLTINPQLVEVLEGDVIYLGYITTASADEIQKAMTMMTVEGVE